jgi:hypothetical protein
MDGSIERRDRVEERIAETYRELFELEVARLRAEWIEQFGNSPRFRFEYDGNEVHKTVLQQMAA